MKILIISKTYAPPYLGAQTVQMSRLLSALQSQGHEVALIAGITLGYEPDNEPFPQIRIPKEYLISGKHGMAKIQAGIHNIISRRYWLQKAIKEGLIFAKNFNPDVILSCSSPLEGHQIANKLRKKLNKPWAAFVSDIIPNSLCPEPYRVHPTGINRFRFHLMERIIRKTLVECDMSLMPNPYAFKWFENELNINISQKSIVVPHFANMDTEVSHSKNNRIIHAGVLDGPRYCPSLIDAARRIRQEYPDKFEGITFVGNVSENFSSLATPAEKEAGLFEFKGHVSPTEAKKYLDESKAALLIEADMAVSPFIPSKFADYVIAGKITLAITPKKSSIRDYITQYGGGICASHDTSEIFSAIKDIIHNQISPPDEKLQQFFMPEYVANIFIQTLQKAIDSF